MATTHLSGPPKRASKNKLWQDTIPRFSVLCVCLLLLCFGFVKPKHIEAQKSFLSVFLSTSCSGTLKLKFFFFFGFKTCVFEHSQITLSLFLIWNLVLNCWPLLNTWELASSGHESNFHSLGQRVSLITLILVHVCIYIYMIGNDLEDGCGTHP